jgi:pilus assembly protein Flp/PilA
VKQAVNKFLTDESGLTTVEYAVAGSLVALTIVLAFSLLGNEVDRTINKLTKAIKAP